MPAVILIVVQLVGATVRTAAWTAVIACTALLTIYSFAAPRPSAPVDAFPELTEREREILALVAQHQTNPEIARRLHLSRKTIRNHVSNVFTKLQVADRAEAIIRAREGGLGRIER